jgi:hypothetical protein
MFPFKQVAEALAVAQRRLLVWHTWTQYFDLLLHSQLVRFLCSAWEAAPVEERICRILLAHPKEAECAKLRTRTLGEAKLDSLLDRTIRDLRRAAQGAAVALGNRPYEELADFLDVRLYSSVLVMPIYIVDDRAFVGWYPAREKSHFAPYLELDASRSSVVRKLENWFMETWSGAGWRWDFRSDRPVRVTSPVAGSGEFPRPIL